MATLNDLRTKGGIVVTIVITIALLAFLVGDFVGGSGGSPNQNSVGEIEKNKIDYVEYVNQTEYIKNVYSKLWNTNTFEQQQLDMVYNEAWNDMVMNYAYRPSFKKMGVLVSTAEQVDMVKGQYLSPIITSFFANPATGVYDAEMMKGFLSNVEDPTVKMLWSYIKMRMNDQRVMENYSNLVNAAFFANDLEVNNGVFAANNSSTIKLIAKPYSSIPDSLVADRVTSADVKKYYKEHKEMFRQSIAREIEYVVFDIFPSEEDYSSAKIDVDELAVEFATTNAPMQFASANSMDSPNTDYFSEDDLNADLAEISFGKKKGEVYGPILNGDIYTMSKLVEIKDMPDSLEARHILLPFTDMERADSLANALENGASFAVLAFQFSQDQGSAQQGGEIGKFTPEQMIPEFSNACINAKKGDIFVVESQAGIHVVELTDKSKMTRKAQIATITYNIRPSEETLQNISDEANIFIADVSEKGFTQAITDLGLSKRNARILSTDRMISGLTNSRELIRWAYNNKKHAVSTNMNIDGNYVVAILTDVKKEGYVPIEDNESGITRTLMNEAKVNWVAEQIASAKTIEEIAEILNVEVQSIENTYGNSMNVEGIGLEMALVGAISVAEEGVIFAPIKGGFNTYVFEVTNKATADNATIESEKVRLNSLPLFNIPQRLDQALKEVADITDNRIKFF